MNEVSPTILAGATITNEQIAEMVSLSQTGETKFTGIGSDGIREYKIRCAHCQAILKPGDTCNCWRCGLSSKFRLFPDEPERYIPAPLFSIFGPDNEILVAIYLDGRITFGPNYKPDHAAKVFWDALATAGYIRSKG